jgi:ligand-binding sensor domain-containing protein
MRLRGLRETKRSWKPTSLRGNCGLSALGASNSTQAEKLYLRLRAVYVPLMAILALALCADPARCGWQMFRTRDGLVHNQVSAVIEDSSGNLWFGTGQGVSRYDGVNWVTYDAASGTDLRYVTEIVEDSSGNLWFATLLGVSRYDGVSWRKYTEDDGLADDYVLTVIEDSSGELWFGTGNGLSCYDGVSWRTYTTADGLAGNGVHAIMEDSSGNLWFCTSNGVSRYDGVNWRTYTTADGLPSDVVTAILEDSSGNMWFGTQSEIGAGGGVSRYDGVSWTTYTTADGLANDRVYSMMEDSSGNLWFGTDDGASRYDGVDWVTYRAADGLANDFVNVIVEDSSGDLWFGTDRGISRFDGENWQSYGTSKYDAVTSIAEDSSGSLWFGYTGGGVLRYDGVSWKTYTEADGLAHNLVNAIMEDSSGYLWFATYNGLSRYKDGNWDTYTEADGLANSTVWGMLEDSSGNLWFGTYNGLSRYNGEGWVTFTEDEGLPNHSVSRLMEDSSGDLWLLTGVRGATVHEPDRVPPRTVIWPRPPGLSANATCTITFTAAFNETQGTTFTYSFDGSPWSDWSLTDYWLGGDLSDGEHVFEVKARDWLGNEDTTPAICAFEIDATPPSPVVLSPSSGQAVRDSIVIEGIADDPRFESYVVEVRSARSAPWDTLAESWSAVSGGPLAAWSTTEWADGDYEIGLAVTDTLGLTGTGIVVVVVDNEAPWAYQTSPARVSPAGGGDVYTSSGDTHLYFPPGGFEREAEVRIEDLGESDVPDTLVDGALRAMAGRRISWEGASLKKPATLELSLKSIDPELLGSDLALYVHGPESTWRRLGGTVDKTAKWIAAPMTEPGLYSVFAEGELTAASKALSALSITPRVFSPRGGFAARSVSIGFTLGLPGDVTVRIYNRAGRLVSEVVSGEKFGAGANLVQWNGRGRNGEIVDDGVYMVTVEAMGRKSVKPLAVVK